MNIFVLLKQVPATSNVKMDEETGTMIRTEHENVINPLDENALEEALRLKRAAQRVKVTALSMGPPPAIKALRGALAMGADSAVLLSDKGFSGSDTLATARALARALEKLTGGCLGSDNLVLCGERATDGETGQVGPMVASLLDVPVVTYARKVDLEGASLVVERFAEEGTERIEVTLPAVLAVVKDINQPGFPTLAGKLEAKKVQIPVLSPSDLGLSGDEIGFAGSPTRVVRVFRPKIARNTLLYHQDGTGAAVDSLLTFLASREVI
ncbi:MAG: electron transfer flavoprotein subunit beta/FixA family protein [Bacteroidota bacterium]